MEKSRGSIDVDVTVVIPTLASRVRDGALTRAVESVLSQRGVSVAPLVVVNGNRFDPDLVSRLREQREVSLLQVSPGSVSLARREGRKVVDTPYFAYLDDDDELLPTAIQLRYDAIRASDADVAVSNGYIRENGCNRLAFQNFSGFSEDPAKAILDDCWLNSASGLYRTKSVPISMLETLPDFHEITYLGFRLALCRKIVRVDTPTFIIHVGTPDRVSQSMQFQLETPTVLAQMETETERPDLRRCIRKKRADAYHNIAHKMLCNGERGLAWKYHLRSLLLTGGIRYVSFSRHFLTFKRYLGPEKLKFTKRT